MIGDRWLIPAMYSLSRHWLLVVLTACSPVGVSYDCHLLFSSCQYQCHLVLNTWPAAATTDDTVDRRRILKGFEFIADQGRKPKLLHKVASLLNFCIFHIIKFMKLNMILSTEWTTYSERLKKNLKNSGLTFAKIRTRRYLHWAGHCEFTIKFFSYVNAKCLWSGKVTPFFPFGTGSRKIVY